jgi:hypothetical protein
MVRCITVAVAAVLATGLLSAPARAQFTYESERAAHPRLAAAIDQLHAIQEELAAAPDDFGGHKAAAMRDIHRAIISVRRALYFRMHMDDRALERAP